MRPTVDTPLPRKDPPLSEGSLARATIAGQDPAFVEVSMRDSGSMIPPGVQKTIFQSWTRGQVDGPGRHPHPRARRSARRRNCRLERRGRDDLHFPASQSLAKYISRRRGPFAPTPEERFSPASLAPPPAIPATGPFTGRRVPRRQALKGRLLKHSNQGITRTQRGEEPRIEHERRTRPAKASRHRFDRQRARMTGPFPRNPGIQRKAI